MIQFNEPIADAYVMPRRNVAMPSTPGRQVKFLQGHAVIKHGRDLVAMMKRPDVQIIMTPYSLSWLETFFKEAGERCRAEVQWPEEPAPLPVRPEEPTPPPVRPDGWDPRPDGADSPDAST